MLVLVMAMQNAVLGSCSHVLHLQQQQPRLLSGGGTVSLWGIASTTVECTVQGGGGARRWRSGSSWQEMGLQGCAKPSSSMFGQRRRRGGVARADQVEVTDTSTTSTSPPEIDEGGITEVDKYTFWPIVQSAGEKIVVLDMYTQWCGPCKLMQPKIIELAGKLDDVIFCKLDCNQHNKPLAKELGVKVVPTFKIFKKNKLAGEVLGAKFPELVEAVENVRKN